MSKKQKEKHRYIFPSPMAKLMKNINMRTQMESSMVSMFLIMITTSLMAIYLVFFGTGPIVSKVLIIINLVCGFLFVSSFLVTTYHQYLSYMSVMNIDPDKEKEEIRKRGNIFKRIALAMKAKKDSIKVPYLLEDSKKSAKEIKELEKKGLKILNKAAKKLRKEFNTKPNDKQKNQKEVKKE